LVLAGIRFAFGVSLFSVDGDIGATGDIGVSWTSAS
jgi:hypothetical protein